jgi:hypothetical protein
MINAFESWSHEACGAGAPATYELPGPPPPGWSTGTPRGDLDRPVTGVFSTRSPDRPNPVGLHRVEILAVDGLRMQVRNLEALDGTPIIDLKPVLDPGRER